MLRRLSDPSFVAEIVPSRGLEGSMSAARGMLGALAGEVFALDLALTGRRIAELEYELLASIDADAASGPLPSGLPQDRPNAEELAALAAHVFGREMLPALGDDRRLQGLMLASALGTVAREIKMPAAASDRSLVEAIRAGRHDPDTGLHAALREEARTRTKIANPKYPF